MGISLFAHESGGCKLTNHVNKLILLIEKINHISGVFEPDVQVMQNFYIRKLYMANNIW